MYRATAYTSVGTFTVMRYDDTEAIDAVIDLAYAHGACDVSVTVEWVYE